MLSKKAKKLLIKKTRPSVSEFLQTHKHQFFHREDLKLDQNVCRRCGMSASSKIHNKPWYDAHDPSLKRPSSRMMTVLEVRRLFSTEVEAFIAEQFGTGMLHSTISLEDADTAFAEFVGLRREAEDADALRNLRKEV